MPGRFFARCSFARLAVASIAVVSAATIACGLTADFSGLQGGARDAGDLGEAGDAALDVDGGSPDAGFCASRVPAPKLCADFDEGKPLDFGWTLLDTSAGQTTRVDSTALSPPGSFLSAIAPVNGTSSARLQESLPVLASRVHIEFAMLLAPGDPGPFELCALHEVTGDGQTYGIFYKEEQGKLLVYMDTVDADGGKTQAIYPLGAPSSSWMNVVIDIKVGDQGSVSVTQDGVMLVNSINVATSTQTRAQLYVELGFYAFASATASAHFDNVVVDWD
jgi:hypothetical protein